MFSKIGVAVVQLQFALVKKLQALSAKTKDAVIAKQLDKLKDCTDKVDEIDLTYGKRLDTALRIKDALELRACVKFEEDSRQNEVERSQAVAFLDEANKL